jgi:hypothetical protein
MHRGLPGITLGYCLLDDVHLTTILCLGTLSDYPSSGSSITSSCGEAHAFQHLVVDSVLILRIARSTSVPHKMQSAHV